MQQSTQRTAEEPQKKEAPLSRRQRRAMEIVNKEAHAMYGKMAKQFVDFFIDHDPDGPEVAAKEKEIIHKWRMFCKHRNLIPAAYDQMNTHCQQVRADYQESNPNEPITE